jgi:plasmid replication initiation protein
MITSKGDTVAVVANQIINARHKLDPRQQKVLAWAIGQIARDDTEFLTHRLSVAEFSKLVGSTSGSVYREMETVTKSLLHALLEIRIDDGDRRRVAFQWLSKCVYREGEGTVEIRFHDELRSYLLELRARFTQLRLEKFYKFRSSYTIRFFEKLEMQRGLNRLAWTMPLAELRDWLGLEPESYAFFGLLRAKVLDVAQRELDQKSDWSFSFQLVKTGRRITGVEFTLRPSRSPKVDPIRDRWKKASPELKAKVLQVAKRKPRWSDETDEAILADSRFWDYLGDMFAEVEQGQQALGLS